MEKKRVNRAVCFVFFGNVKENYSQLYPDCQVVFGFVTPHGHVYCGSVTYSGGRKMANEKRYVVTC